MVRRNLHLTLLNLQFVEVISCNFITGATVPSQLVPVPVFVRNLPGRTAKTTAELVFAADIPAVGVASYFVHRQKSKNTGEENADYLYANLKSAEYKDADQIVLGSSVR